MPDALLKQSPPSLALNLSSYFTKPARQKGNKFNVVETYPYRDTEGLLLFEVCRLNPKSFRQRQPDPSVPGKWIWNLKGVRLVPYRLPELLTAVKAGEKISLLKVKRMLRHLLRKDSPPLATRRARENGTMISPSILMAQMLSASLR